MTRERKKVRWKVDKKVSERPVEINVTTSLFKFTSRGLVIKYTSSYLKKKKLNFSILLNNDAEIKEINFKYRNLNKPTNVLSFQSIIDKNNYFKNIEQEIHLGEIIISMERIFSESKINNVLFKDHFIHIFLHGILHILGYDHEIDSERIKMEKTEISILKNLGIKNPYA